MASSSSNPPAADASASKQDLEYLYASNTNVSNFVSVKLSGHRNYHLWKKQMLCLMDAHGMRDLVDNHSSFVKKHDDLLVKKYESLLKGWIFGSVSEDVLHIVVDDDSVKDVWKKLKSYFDSTMSNSKQDSAPTKEDKKTKTKDKNVGEIANNDEGVDSADLEAKEDKEATQIETKDSASTNADTKAKMKDKNVVVEEIATNDEGMNSAESKAKRHEGAQIETKGNDTGGNNQQRGAPTQFGYQHLQQLPHHDFGYTQRPPHGGYYGTPVQQLPYRPPQLPPPYGGSSPSLPPQYPAAPQSSFGQPSYGGGGGFAYGQRPPYAGPQPQYNNDFAPVFSSMSIQPPAQQYYNYYMNFGNGSHMQFNQFSAPTTVDADTESKYKDKNYPGKREDIVMMLQEHVANGDWYKVYTILRSETDAITEKINIDGNTALHISVGIGRDDLIKSISSWLTRYNKVDLTTMKNWDGSTVLHIAAMVGNTKAAEVLVKENQKLLHITDNKDQTPLDKACENLHFDMIDYLLEAAERYKKDAPVDGTGNTKSSLLLPHVDRGVNLLANVISAKRYDSASKLISRNPEYVAANDAALMAMARTFPSGLDYGENLMYPRLDNTRKIDCTKGLIVRADQYLPKFFLDMIYYILQCCLCYCYDKGHIAISIGALLIIGVPVAVVYCIFVFLLMVYFMFFMLYFLMWKFAARIGVPAVKNIELKNKEYEEAKKVLELVCEKIKNSSPDDHSGSHELLYRGPILEAACQDAYEVVEEILQRWPEAIRCKDKNGYDIIQLATINRSERVYNLIYVIGLRKNIYKIAVDPCLNNMLHLAARLAPSNKLKRITGAALQLQRELQWRQEVQKHVLPINITKENIFRETPETVFTKEHENLVKEGEKWMKAVAESSSITAALITTIVFAAAITVPGGNNQETGVPVFLTEGVFTVFAIADAISLFSSATALLVFLSILTARFAEEDFLVRLPRRLIIGLFTLLLSTTSMMVAFSATLFLVFSRRKLWVLGPICGLALVPIGFFFVLQFPLILDLIRSTYVSKFGKSNHNGSKLNPNNIRVFFSK